MHHGIEGLKSALEQFRGQEPLFVKGHGPVDAMQYPRFSGIRTFMRLPELQELENVDFAVIGIPFDTGATFRAGARFGAGGDSFRLGIAAAVQS